MDKRSKGKEIIVATMGDANSVDTWSNVPYFFTKTLEKKGYIVHRVNIEPNSAILKIAAKIFDKLYITLFNPEKKSSVYNFTRTTLAYNVVNKKIREAVKQYPNTELIISTNLSHSGSSVSNIKSLMFGDWTISHIIEKRLEREPNFWEKRSIKKQDEEIRKSNYNVVLFPDVYEYMKEYYKTDNIYYLGNVINSEIIDVDIDSLYKNRRKSNTLLFIGRKAYISSAKSLIKAVEMLNKDKVDNFYRVKLIGMTEDDFEEKSEYVEYMGYLSKGDADQKKKYYDSVLNSLAVINTTEKWSGASSMIECMYYGTPVITSPYEAFVETFGEDINFGYYSSNKPEDIKGFIESLGTMPEEEYRQICKNSNEAVKDFTWDNYIEKVVTLAGLK